MNPARATPTSGAATSRAATSRAATSRAATSTAATSRAATSQAATSARASHARRVTWSCPHPRCAAENTLLAPPAAVARVRGTATARWVMRAPCLRCGRPAFLSGLSLYDPYVEGAEPIDFDVRDVEAA